MSNLTIKPIWTLLAFVAIYIALASLGENLSKLMSIYEYLALLGGLSLGLILSLRRGFAIAVIVFGSLCVSMAYPSTQPFSFLLYLAFSLLVQTVVSAVIYRSLISRDNILDQDSELIRLLLTSPVIGMVGAITMLLASYIVASQTEVINVFFRLWALFSLSTLLLTPLTVGLFHEHLLWRKRRILLTVNIAFLCALAAMLIFQVRVYNNTNLEQRFTTLTNQAASLLVTTLREKALFQKSVSQLFVSSQTVSRQEFTEFVHGLTGDVQFVQVIEWLPLIKHEQRAEYEFEQAKKYGHEFTITQVLEKGVLGRAKDKEVYFPITYLEPERDNLIARGFDPSSSVSALEIINKAVESSTSQAREPIDIIRKSGMKRALIVYKPLFKQADGKVTVTQQNAELYGFINMVIRIEDLIDTVLGDSDSHQYNIDWLDQASGKYYHQTSTSNSPQRFTHTVSLHFAGREMTLTFSPTQSFFSENEKNDSFVVLLGVLMIGALVSLLLLNITARTSRIRTEVELRTEELHLATQQARESELKMRQAYNVMQIAEEQLKLSDVAFNSASEAIFITDEDLKVIAINSAFTTITGYVDSDILRRSAISLIVSVEDETSTINEFWGNVNHHKVWRGEVIVRKNDGNKFPAYVCMSTVKNDNEQLTNLVGVFSDMTEAKKAQQAIEHHANYDALTGLPNRRLFNDRLQHSISRAKRHNSRLCLMFLDLDRFKDINDTLGHEFGDELLMRVATRLQKVLREADTVARLGGDEFTVIIDNVVDKDNIEFLAEKLVHEIKRPLHIQNQTLTITTSIGITFYPDDSTDSKVLIQNADRAMYDAKDFGGNTFKVYNSELEASWNARHFIINELEAAIEQQQLIVYYQPIVNARYMDKVKCAEALVRWQHPERGLLLPGEFLPVAERMGVIDRIDDFVFEQVCKQLSEWKKQGIEDIRISVNQSALNFGKLEGRLRWDECIEHYGIRFEQITMEITESILMQRSTDTRKYIQFLRDKGIKVAVDDFGTGYSSLAYLKAMDIDYLKIDQSFVRDIESDENDKAIITAIVEMAKHLNIEVVAEGVETYAQQMILNQVKCQWQQGYFYSRPVMAEQITDKLERQKPNSKVRKLIQK